MAGRIGFVLSGGGSKGAFEVGALRYLYESGIRPDVVTGSSVGAINALKLAEGDDKPSEDNPFPSTAQQKLEHVWRELEDERDMYELEPWVQAIENLRVREFITREFGGLGGNGASSLASWVRLPTRLMYGIVSSGMNLSEISEAIDTVSTARSIFNFSPLERLLRDPAILDPERVRMSGIALRLSIVGLESGTLRHVTESGEILGTNEEPVDLVDAALASASIPLVFPPRKLGSENYVDGGTREILPLRTAIDAGATELYAITAFHKTLPVDSFDDESLLNIGLRAIGDVMVDEILEGDVLRAHQHDGTATLTIIRPTIDVHDLMTIEPGLISISMDYGYMRASDHLHGTHPDRMHWLTLSDRITRLRLDCWSLEERLGGSAGSKIRTHGERTTLETIQSMKQSIYEAVWDRRQAGAPVPSGAEAWWRQWELHRSEMIAASPWDRIVTTFGLLGRKDPPPR
jgi:NTE family protein